MLATASLLLAVAPLPQRGWMEANADTQFFTIPVTRDAVDHAEKALEHIGSRRWSEALRHLQRLLTDHAGDLLPHGWGAQEAPYSLYRTHSGAAEHADRLLRSLPREALDLYRARYGPAARQALAEARDRGDRRALMDVASRWPITEAAEGAWWTLGDLELELGHVEAALENYRRARELVALAERDLPPGAERRFQLCAELGRGAELTELPQGSSGTEGSDTPTTAGLFLSGPGQGNGPIPKADADEPWSVLLPNHPYGSGIETYNLYPVLSGDRVFVNTSLRVLAVDAYSGRTLWTSDEPSGWVTDEQEDRRDFYKGIDRTSGMIAAAASDGVVVAPLQVRYENLPNSDFQGITIMVTIPERRLFAFDAETGEPLWNHEPPPAWDGFSGSFGTRMQVAGPPVIAGSRVLVPSYRLQSRIDYHVACYDLFSGDLLWQTSLISGQRELNMFGRHEEEFCAPPVRVEGDVVLALTQLGTLGALDLFTGRILWESLYEQIALPKTRTWTTQNRQQYWRNAPPVVADGAVLATPLDSDSLTAFDLETGAQLWSWRHRNFKPPGTALAPNVLLGADRDTVYFGGGSVSAWRKPDGLGTAGGSFSNLWFEELKEIASAGHHPDTLLRTPPRPLLGRDEILVQTPKSRVTVERRGSGRRSASVAWTQREMGNALLGNGVLYTLSGRYLSGFFDWHVLLRRAHQRLAESPNDSGAILDLGGLLGRQGRRLREDGDRSGALEVLSDAREVLEPQLVREPGDVRLAESLHGILRTEAAVRADGADVGGALTLLERALELTRDLESRRDTLLELEALSRVRRPDRWLEVLEELLAIPSVLSVPEWSLTRDGSPYPENDPWVGVAAEDRPPVPLGLWVLVQRASAWAERGRVDAELEDLHAILALYPEYPLPGDRNGFQLADERIRERLERAGREVYATFEARAAERLDTALAASDRAGLETLIRRFPHSDAAMQARRTLLDWGFRAGDAAEVARRVQESLSGDSLPTDEDRVYLSKLALVLGRSGNHRIARAMHDAFFRSADSDAARAVQRFVEELPPPPAPDSYDGVVFDETLQRVESLEGTWEYVGRTSSDDGQTIMVLGSGRELAAFSSARPADPLWATRTREPIPPTYTRAGVAVTHDRVLVGTAGEVAAYDLMTGVREWSWASAARDIYSMRERDGVVLVQTGSSSANVQVRAFDTHSGSELWSRRLPSGNWLPDPTFGDGLAVYTTNNFGSPPALAITLDLFRGTELALFDIFCRVGPEHGGWIDGRALLLPVFQPTRPTDDDLLAIDVTTGAKLWGLRLERDLDLHSVALHGDDAYLVARSGRQQTTDGEILELDASLGATRKIVNLQLGQEPLGWRSGHTVELEAPYLFLLERISGASSIPVTAVHLPSGPLWLYRLPVSEEELSVRLLPTPAISRDTIALAYHTKSVGSKIPGVLLHLVDRATGVRRDSRRLSPQLSSTSQLRMRGLGSSLFLIGATTAGESQTEIWTSRKQ